MIYLLQVNIGLMLFYAFYKLICTNDTFFAWRRVVLIVSLIAPFIIPLINIGKWMESRNRMIVINDFNYSKILPEVIIGTSGPETSNFSLILANWLTITYLTGVILLLLRFSIQTVSIFKLIRKSPTETINGIRIKKLEQDSGPFSFFGWIFVNRKSLKKNKVNEVLIHELTHARQKHSIDVLLAEIVNITCWLNPFSWLLKKEIRQNLEYMADRKVIESGIEIKSYQYYLLGLSYKSQQGLSNSFNISHLKQRIIMMNKKKTSNTGYIKYTLFTIPAFVLLLTGNISCSSEVPKTDVREVPIEKIATRNEVFMVVEHMPEFPGGMKEFMNFLNSNIKYPETAIKKSIQGRVIVQFIVEKDGTPTEFKILRSVDSDLDKEALRVLNKMPKWKPGIQRGQAVRVKYTVPVTFKLQ